MKFSYILIVFVSIFSPFQSLAKTVDYNNELGTLCWPTQFSYENKKAFISDYKNKRIIFRGKDGRFDKLNINLKGAHSIRYIKRLGYLIDDTEANKIILISDLNNPHADYLDKIAGKQLVRPHDILDGQDGYAYIIDENNLFRIKDFSGKGDVFPLMKDKLGYVRSLSMMDGKVHIISASMGKVIKIDDFNSGKIVQYQTGAHKLDDAAGSADRTGPILNSVIKLGGYYYGSNYFTKSYAGNNDPNPYRLMRWKSWDDFRKGNFEDISNYLEKNQVPYFLSSHEGKLLLTTFNHEKPCDGDRAFYFKP